MSEELLEKLLEGQDTATREKVLNIVFETGLRPSDPLFLLMVANSTVQVLLNQAPNELKQTFHDCCQRMRSEYSGYERAALAGVKEDIAKTVDQLVTAAITQGSASKSLITYRSLAIAGFAALGLLLAGATAGFGITRWFVQMDGRGLTASEVSDLNWSQSREGRFARQLFDWNPDLPNRQCEARVQQDLGAIRIGSRTATSGYCFIWTQPPNKRKFQE